MTLNELASAALDLTTRKGFHETEDQLNAAVSGRPELETEVRSLLVARRLALIQSEISEALEACRKNKHADIQSFQAEGQTKEAFEKHVKDSFEDELADALIRILELAATENIDIDTHVSAKMKYNAQRPYKFGKAY